MRVIRRAIILAALLVAYPTGSLAAGPSILVDLETGDILAGERIHDRWYPASLTKMMTAYVAFRAIRLGEIEDGSPVIISRAATRQPPSRMGYKQGVRMRLDTALKITIVKSANDVSQALAEAVAGSLSVFVARMNAEAARLGMSNSQFANAHGLHATDQYTSARDMAVLVRAIQKEFPEYASWFSAPAIKTDRNTHYSYNLLLERFPGATGMKTGFVCASGYNFAATAERSGRSLAAIVFGRNSQTDRAVSAAKLLTEGFNGKSGNGGSLNDPAPAGAAPKNMRPILCTEEARKNRYDPGAGQAVIKSQYLTERQRVAAPMRISLGGVDAPPGIAAIRVVQSNIGRVPVPTRRPDVSIQATATAGEVVPNIPVPTPRPRS